MKLIRFISALIVMVFLMAAFGSSAWAAGIKRPNIIFILTDDLSPKDYAFYGGKTASPVLEKMAKEGLYFKTAWATPKCVPTRAMLLTGKYPFRTKVFENQVNPRGANNLIKPVGERFPNTLGSLMTASGYRTAMIGKIQTGTVQSYGFQRWCLVNQGKIFDMKHSDNDVDGKRVVQRDVHSTDSLFDYLHGFTAEKSRKPWFVYMPLNLPHWVRNPDDPRKWGPPVVPELDKNWKKTGKLVQNDFEACIRYIDYKIGGFVEHLKATGQLENTIIMYAGDNGSGTYGKSNPDSEKGPRIPFVVYAPGYLKSMGACDELVDLTDVVPTCVELAGGSLPKGDIFDGHSFAPLIQGKPFEGREWIFTQWYGCRWLRTRQWLIDGLGRFYDCGDNRNEWVPGAYKDVTESVNEKVIAVRKNLERILETMPAPDYDDPELAAQWEKEWLNSRKFVQPYAPPYLKSAPSEEKVDLLFNDPPNEYRIVKYQLNNKTLVQYPQYGFGGYQPFFYDNLYKAGPTGPSRIGPLVDAAIAQGRTVWGADDNGYPSGSAGGKVVENNPEYEVRGVAMLTKTGSGQVPVSISTPSDCEKMVSAVLYPMADGVSDFSQGQVQPVKDTGVSTTGLAGDWKLCAFILKIRDSNTQCADRATQFRTTGRYPDLLNPNAVKSWISLVHEPIIAQVTDPTSQFEGFYFNEPSLQQLNWHKTAYATLPWNAELFNKFQAMHGYDLEPAMGALYESDDLYAKRVRMHFHQTVGEMLRTSFTGQLAEWCEKRGLAASGHPLLEEYLRMHVANFGDMLKVVSELQVPAMDLPMPEPGQMARHNFHFPKLFSSAGVWNESDSRVIALLDPVIGGYGRNRKVPSEQALYIAVNGAFRCGVNLFATYMNTDRYGSKAVGIFKQLNEYTGRISVMLTGARIAPPVALYYPIEMFQMEYQPITARHFGKWNTRRQFAWDNLQTTMLDAEVDYNIVHPEWVRDAAIEGGELKIGSGSYRYLVMPDVEVISSKVLAKIKQFEAAGGTVLWVDGKPMAGAYPSEDAQVVRAVAGVATVSAAQVPGLISNPYDAKFTLNVTSQNSLLTTRFERQGRSIYFMVNPTGSSITAHLDDANGGSVKVYDPVTGKITLMPLPTDVVINAYKSVLSVPVSSSISSDSPEKAAAESAEKPKPISGARTNKEGKTIQATLTGVSGDKTPKPNVIMILIDDMGWADSAPYGSKYYDTPNLTRLAKDGMMFTDAYAASPLCSPTRASIMSGQHPARIRMTQAVTPKDVPEPKALPPRPDEYSGLVQNRNNMPLEVFTLAEALKEAGYSTAHIGKWHLSPPDAKFAEGDSSYHAENQGFDFVIGGAHLPGPPDYYSPYARKGRGIRNLKPGPEGEYLNERLAEESIKWIDSVKDSGKPFYLNFWHYAVHGPIIPKKDLLPKYNQRRDPNAGQRCPEMATMLDSMDNSIGILLDWLDKPANRELKENTLIILTSDNGGVIHNQVNGNPWTSNRPLRGGKANTYEGGVREPWIVRWPGKIEAGTVCREPVQSTDIYPTVLEAAGLKRRAGIPLDGRSIVPLLLGDAMKPRPIFTHFPHNMGALCAPSTSVRAGDWKLIRFYHAGKNAASHAYELFDLKRDPSEAINLATYFPEKVRELDQLIESFLEDTEALVPLGNSKYEGDPQATRTAQSLNKAPKRPRALRLPAPAIKPATAGNRLIQLADQDGVPRSTHALVLEGSEWVRVRNNDDGSVELNWDAAPQKATAKILFGWKGGAIPQEINAATIPPCELELSARGSKITREYEFTMPSPSQSAAKAPAPKRRWQDQFFKSRDRNGDGFVTLEEFIGDPKNRNVPVLTKRYRQFDSNGDGKLLLEELKKQTR